MTYLLTDDLMTRLRSGHRCDGPVLIKYVSAYDPEFHEFGFDPDGDANVLDANTDDLTLSGDRLAEDWLAGLPPWRERYRILPDPTREDH